MKPRECLRLTALSFAALLLAGCLTRPSGEAASSSPAPEPGRVAARTADSSLSPAERSEAYARFASGYSYEMNDQADRAFEQYYKSVQADPGNDTLVVEVARRLLQKRQPEQARKLLARSTARKDADGTVYAWYARACLALGKTNEAAQAGLEALRRAPNELEGYESLFELYNSQDRVQDALNILNRAEKVAEADGPFLLGVAEAYEHLSHSAPAKAATLKLKIVALLKRAAGQQFDDPIMRQRLADRLLAHGESQLAATIYLDLLEQFDETPGLRDALREKLATIYLQAKDRKKAAEQLEAIVRDNPTRYPQAYYYLATMAYEDKDYTNAAGYFSKLLVIDPDLEQAYYDLAGLKITLDQPGEALQVLDKARARFPQNFVAEYFTGLALSKAKNYAESARHFNTAEVIALASDAKRLSADFYFQFGAACERNKQYEDAEKYFLKSIKINPDFAEALNYLGYMWAERNEKLEQAREFVEKAVKLQPKNGAYLDSMGWVLFRLKDYDGALKFELKAVENIEETDASLYDHLGEIYVALKRRDKAIEAWRKSLQIESSDEVKRKLQNLSTNSAS